MSQPKREREREREHHSASERLPDHHTLCINVGRHQSHCILLCYFGHSSGSDTLSQSLYASASLWHVHVVYFRRSCIVRAHSLSHAHLSRCMYSFWAHPSLHPYFHQSHQGSLLNAALGKVLKLFLSQPRPDGSRRPSYGMPSSHANSLFFFATFLSLK